MDINSSHGAYAGAVGAAAIAGKGCGVYKDVSAKQILKGADKVLKSDIIKNKVKVKLEEVL